jgi:hypothetical protein
MQPTKLPKKTKQSLTKNYDKHNQHLNICTLYHLNQVGRRDDWYMILTSQDWTALWVLTLGSSGGIG